jgi:hypothetical protein
MRGRGALLRATTWERRRVRRMVWERRRAGTVLFALLVAAALLLALAPISRAQSPDDSGASSSSDRKAQADEQHQTPDSERLLQIAEREGTVRVIVGLRTDFAPEGGLSRPEVADQRDEIQRAQAGLQEDLRGTGYRTVREFDTIPFVALELPPKRCRRSNVPRSPPTSWRIVRRRPTKKSPLRKMPTRPSWLKAPLSFRLPPCGQTGSPAAVRS